MGIRGTTRVNIDREAIFDSIKVYGDSFFSTQLKVEFTGERGQDCNGLRREFFTLLSKDFIEKRLLKEEESTYFVIDNNGDDINELPNYHFMGQLFAYAIKSGNLINVRLHPIILYSLLNSTYGERKYNILETDGHKLFEFFDTISKEDTKLILEHISLELKYSDRNINGISTIEEILEKIRNKKNN